MMDPGKLKVVELRAELSKRGLDAKGNKPVLVERLRKALEKDIDDGAPNTSPEDEPTQPNTHNENVGEAAYKDVREKTPEPTNKTSGRTSRSSSATTPTKVPSTRSSPKIMLTPLSEKQMVPAKSPTAEKKEKISEGDETLDKEIKIVQEQDEAEATNISITESETTKEIVESDTLTSEVTEEVMEKVQPESTEQVQEIEEKVTSSDLAEGVCTGLEQFPHTASEESSEAVADENSKAIVEESSDVVSEEAENTSEAVVECNDDQEMVKQQVASELKSDAQASDEAMDEIEANEDNDYSSEVVDTTPKVESEEIDVKTDKDDTAQTISRVDEAMEAEDDVSIKKDIDEKLNIDPALQPVEQDVEIKDIKEDVEEDSERDSKDRDRKDRKRKRSLSPQDEKQKTPPPSDDEPDLKEDEVVLSWYDSDLNLVINKESFVSATAMHNEGFGYVWAGARASYGFTEGKVYFEAKITEYCDVNLPDEESPHVLRVGWSIQGTSMQLGEEPFTYGFDGIGKISTGNQFSDYGTTFSKDDVVGCYLDLTDDTNVIISYTIIGKDMGTAFTVPKTDLEGKPLYPHILTKNCTVVCNFGQEEPWSKEILDGFVPVGTINLESRVHGPRRPEKKQDCEMIVMCGLPAAGKTTWAIKYSENHPEKMYNILGTNHLIEKMKVIGLPRKRNYRGRWDTLIEKCGKCVKKLLELASSRRRNYILDQTNVSPSDRRHKMRNFHGYQCRAIVVVPSEEEYKSRMANRTVNEGEVVPEHEFLDMKAKFSPPTTGSIFDVVEWVELPAEEGKKLIEKYNKEGRDAGYGSVQANKRPRFDRTDNHRDNRDSRQNSRDSRDSRDHRDRRNNYPDRNRTSTWRGGNNSGGWRDRQQRPTGGHVRHGGSSSSSGGGYGGTSSGGWRGRGTSSGPPSSYRPSNDRRAITGHDRRSSSGSDRNRSTSSRQGGWGPMSSYQNSQQSSGNWGGGSQSGNWPSSQSQQQGTWGSQQGGWGQQQQQQQQQQQWGNWKGYGQGNYSQGNYSQSGYGNGNWGSWNQQYYNQYWGQQQSTGQTSAGGSQAGNTSSPATGNSATSTGSTYSSYSPGWQSYTQSYGYPAESSNTNAQQQK